MTYIGFLPRWLTALILCLFSGLPMAGCGAPQYPDPSENTVEFERTLFGIKAKVRNGADTDGSAEDISYNRGTQEVHIKNLVFKSAQSKNQELMIQWMAQYREQQTGYRDIRVAEWAGVNEAVHTIVSAGGQLALQAYQGRLSVDAMKVMRPRLIESAISLIRTDGADPVELLSKLPSEVSDAVRGRLEADGLPPTVTVNKPPLPPLIPASQPTTNPLDEQ